MKFISYFILFIVFASVLFIFLEAGIVQFLTHTIGLGTIILSVVIILCTNRIVKTIKSLKE